MELKYRQKAKTRHNNRLTWILLDKVHFYHPFFLTLYTEYFSFTFRPQSTLIFLNIRKRVANRLTSNIRNKNERWAITNHEETKLQHKLDTRLQKRKTKLIKLGDAPIHIIQLMKIIWFSLSPPSSLSDELVCMWFLFPRTHPLI